MILQKLASAIRRQDWFQVLVEILIVIVGIFLGLQVQGWYENQAERTLEREYLERLHHEIVEVQEFAKRGAEQVTRSHDILANLREKYLVNRTLPELTNAECLAIQRSNITTNYIRPISTLDEMEATGRSAIISNKNLREQITYYNNTKASTDRVTGQLMITSITLLSKYPLLMETSISSELGGKLEEISNHCHSELMNTSPGFQNDLLINIGRFGTYSIVLTQQFNALSQLRNVIELELGVTHEENGI